MIYLNIEKIEQKKTKTLLTLSIDTGETSQLNSNEAFKRLLAIAVVSGGSANAMRQSLNGGLSKELDFDLLSNLQDKVDNLIFDATYELDRVADLQGIKTDTQRFY